MSRNEPDPQSEREQLKQEIKTEIRHEARRKKLLGCGGCLLLWLVILGVPIYLVSSALAKTGFVEVPVLSARQYRASSPVRIVTPLVGSDSETVLRVAAAKMKYEPRTGLATISFTGQELTTIAMEAAQSVKESLPFPVRSVQVAVDPDMLEIFLISPQERRDATVRIRLSPKVAAGEFAPDVKEIMVGALVVPPRFADAALRLLSKNFGRSLAGTVGELGELYDVELGQGVLRLVIRPANP